MDSRQTIKDDTLEGGDPGGIVPDRRALDELFTATYEELRRLAATVRSGDVGATLSPTTLVNEAWLKLANSHRLAIASPLHFKRIAARAMRQVLVEAARRRNAMRRGGDALMVTFEDDTDYAWTASGDVLALNDALNELGRVNPRQAMVVETRFFGGLGIAETAEALQVSEATVLRDWRAARAWLSLELHPH